MGTLGKLGNDEGVQMGWWNARGYEDAFQGGEDPAISPKPKKSEDPMSCKVPRTV